ncbi:MAG: C25 family cysteine peptidase, partial [Lentimicrobiaceae bacterium]|nr:C25 family cysteine peptidase [Lentimicrobiaceae bacterium]
MKKLLFFVILCLLISGQIFAQTRISVSSGKNQLELTQNSRDGFSVQNSIAYFDIQLEKMFTQGEYVVLNVDGYGTSFNIGNPDLHVLNRLIEVPLGATVEVKIISYDEMVFNLSDYDINKQLFPAQESVSKSSDPTTIVLQKNITAYETDKWFSNPLARFHEEGIMRGVRFGRLEISPFAYNPVAGELKVYNNLKVEVKFLKSDFARTESVKKQYYTPAFNGLFSGMLNYDSNLTREDLTFNSIPMHFVIISHRMFEQTLAPFIAWKKKQGFLVTLRYTDEAEVGTTTTSIKNYLQGLYANASPTAPAPAFIALVGDVAQVPTYVGMAPPNTPHPTDLYYTTYDGASDIIPDVFIGRM